MSKSSTLIKVMPGVKVHKSLRDALTHVSEELEKQHLTVSELVKQEHKKEAAKLLRPRSR